MNKATFKPVAERALLVELGTVIDDEVNRRVIALDKAITDSGLAGVIELVPAMVNLLIVFDPLVTNHAELRIGVEHLLSSLQVGEEKGRNHILDVCYEEAFAPDLESVAETCGLSVEQVIERHSQAQYRVSMFGFLPGYGYLSGVPDAIQVPRKENAIRDVRKGSVIIAGAQCIVMTFTMPAGWARIGHCEAQIITDDPDRPFLFDVGDTVSFRPISSSEMKCDTA